MAELEAHGGQGPSDLLKDELTQSLEELEALLKAKDEVGSLFYQSCEAARCKVTGVDECSFNSLFSGNPHFAKQESRVP